MSVWVAGTRQPGKRQVMSRQRTKSASFFDGRYRFSGGACPGCTIGVMVAPMVARQAIAPGRNWPPINAAGRRLASLPGLGVMAAVRVRSLSGVSNSGGWSPSRAARSSAGGVSGVGSGVSGAGGVGGVGGGGAGVSGSGSVSVSSLAMT
ncbi:hypothetical protein [Mycobacterium sp. NPDC006124]|uniref:hypothetical protein n=1 Tax=Mycobacterium sp. NPDC006124 TaxID=3156729 RepID=UPI00339FC36C